MRLAALLMLAATTAAAAAPAPPSDKPVVSHGWTRATAGVGATAVAYFTIDNPGPPDALTAIACDGTQDASLHDEHPAANMAAMPGMAVMSMPLLHSIAVPSGGHVVLHPGSLHAMLDDMQQRLRPGDTLACRLTFVQAGVVPVVLKVAGPGATTPP